MTLPPMERCRSAVKPALLETSETVSDHMRDYALFILVYMYYHSVHVCMINIHWIYRSSDLN